jgi:formate C-acetyltransferase
MGLTNAADSLAAIKSLVFDEKYIDFETLLKALKANFSGFEDLLLKIKKDVPKFGNDNPYVDDIRADITKCLFDALREQESIIGGHYIPGEVIFIAHEPHGSCTGATPDGRLHGEVLADSAGASQGKDLNGPTALINSVLKIPVDEIVTSVVLNIKFIKKFWSRDKNKAIMLIKSFFKQGGQQMQINVCDNEVLQKAYDNPDEYRSLIIRVGGYSAYFTTLSKTLQLEIIKRTAQM